MITYEQQRPAFYLLLLAFTYCINVPLQAMDEGWIERNVVKAMTDNLQEISDIIPFGQEIDLDKCCTNVIPFSTERSENPDQKRFYFRAKVIEQLNAAGNKQKRNTKQQKSIFLFPSGCNKTQNKIVETLQTKKMDYKNGSYYCLTLNGYLRAVHFLVKKNNTFVCHAIRTAPIPVRIIDKKKLSLSQLILISVFKFYNDGDDNGVRAFIPKENEKKHKKIAEDFVHIGFKEEKGPAPVGYTSLKLCWEKHRELCNQELDKQSFIQN